MPFSVYVTEHFPGAPNEGKRLCVLSGLEEEDARKGARGFHKFQDHPPTVEIENEATGAKEEVPMHGANPWR